jgi:hypothetical protein
MQPHKQALNFVDTYLHLALIGVGATLIVIGLFAPKAMQRIAALLVAI